MKIKLKNEDKRLNSLVNKTEFGQQTLALDTYNQTTHEEYIQTIKANVNNGTVAIYHNLRIRKLTPKECWRLMGVHDADYEKVAVNQSNASMYHLAGDSIVVNVLMAIFGQMIEEKL